MKNFPIEYVDKYGNMFGRIIKLLQYIKTLNSN